MRRAVHDDRHHPGREGAPVADQSVAWSFVTKQSASDTINKTPTVTNAQGIATTTVTLGAVSGQRQIRATVTRPKGARLAT